MNSIVTIVAAFLVPCALAVGRSNKVEWAPEEMYNPITEPRSCGLTTDEPGYICDPNGIVGDEIESFQWILREAARNGTECPCSTYHCEHHKGFTGYRIGVALVNQMSLQRREDGQLYTPEAQAQIFAYHLESTKWRMGDCEEDIVIFYSLKDRVLAMFGGSTAEAKFKPKYRDLVAHKVSQRFEDGKVIEALHNLIFDVKLILNCDFIDHDCGIHESRYPGNSATHISLSSGVIALGSVMAAFSLWL